MEDGTRDRFEEVFQGIDQDESGNLDFPEFLRFLEATGSVTSSN